MALFDSLHVFRAGRRLVDAITERQWAAVEPAALELASRLGYPAETAVVSAVLEDVKAGAFENLLRVSAPALLICAANVIFGPPVMGTAGTDAHPQQTFTTPAPDVACGVELCRLAERCQKLPLPEPAPAAA